MSPSVRSAGSIESLFTCRSVFLFGLALCQSLTFGLASVVRTTRSVAACHFNGLGGSSHPDFWLRKSTGNDIPSGC